MTDFKHNLTDAYKREMRQVFGRAFDRELLMKDNSNADLIHDATIIFERGLYPNQNDGAIPPYDEALKLDGATLTTQIGNYVQLPREVDGESKVLNYHAWNDSALDFKTTQITPLSHNHFELPTLMTPQDLEIMRKPDNPYTFKGAYDSYVAVTNNFLSLPEKLDPVLVALGAMSSYYRELFESYPYYDFYSQTQNTGKTTAAMTLTNLSYNGLFLTSVTPAVLFRLIDRYQCVLGIDEIGKQFKNPDASADLWILLNGGYKKGIPCFRCDPITREPISYDGFGLKVFSRKDAIPLDLMSRCITFNMEENKTRELDTHAPLPEQFTAQRSMMYLLRAKCYRQVRQQHALVNLNTDLKGRTKELFGPLLTMAALIDPTLEADIFRRARQDEHDKDKLKITDYDVQLIATLDEIVESGENESYDGTMVKFWGPVPFKYIHKKYTERLQSLGMITEPTKDEDGNIKKQGSRAKRNLLLNALRGLGFKVSDYHPNNVPHWNIDKALLERKTAMYCRDLGELPGEHGINQVNHTPKTDNIDNIDNKTPENSTEKPTETLTTKVSATPSADTSEKLPKLPKLPVPDAEGDKPVRSSEKPPRSSEFREIDGVKYPYSKWSNGGDGYLIIGECVVCGRQGAYEVSAGVKLDLIPCVWSEHAKTGVKEVRRVGGGA